jgi:hypothetical protein
MGRRLRHPEVAWVGGVGQAGLVLPGTVPAALERMVAYLEDR